MNLSPLIHVLRHRRRFRWLFFGMLLSRIGDTFNLVALSWLTLEIAGPRELGLVFLLGGLPSVISGPLAGYFLDRFGVRPLLLADNVLRAGLISAIPALIWLHAIRIEHLYVLVFLTSLLSMVTEIGHEIVVPALVEDAELESANTLLSVIWDVSAWIGPALAGVLIQTLGVAPALLVDAGTFIGMSMTAMVLPVRLGPRDGAVADAGPVGGLSRLLAGFNLLWQLKPVAVMTGVGVGVLALTGMMEIVLPVFSQETVQAGAAGYGLLVSIAGLGSLAGTVLLTPRLARLRAGVAVALVLAVRGLFLAPLAFVRTLPPAAVFLAVSNLADGPFYPLNRSIMQRASPPHLRGRIFGAKGAISAAGFPLGSALGGLMLGAFDLSLVVSLVALAHLPMIVAVLFTSGLMQPVRRGAEERAEPIPTT